MRTKMSLAFLECSVTNRQRLENADAVAFLGHGKIITCLIQKMNEKKLDDDHTSYRFNLFRMARNIMVQDDFECL